MDGRRLFRCHTAQAQVLRVFSVAAIAVVLMGCDAQFGPAGVEVTTVEGVVLYRSDSTAVPFASVWLSDESLSVPRTIAETSADAHGAYRLQVPMPVGSSPTSARSRYLNVSDGASTERRQFSAAQGIKIMMDLYLD